jgi:hypothetical protein
MACYSTMAKTKTVLLGTTNILQWNAGGLSPQKKKILVKLSSTKFHKNLFGGSQVPTCRLDTANREAHLHSIRHL